MINQSASEIRARIDKFVQELDVLVRRQTLDALKAVLGGGDGAPRASAAPARARGRRGRRAAAVSPETTGKLLEIIQAGEGVSVSELAAQTGSSSKDLRKPLQALIAEKKIHMQGQRRGTRYHAGSSTGSGKGRRKA